VLPSRLIAAGTAEDVAQPRYGPEALAIGLAGWTNVAELTKILTFASDPSLQATWAVPPDAFSWTDTGNQPPFASSNASPNVAPPSVLALNKRLVRVHPGSVASSHVR
jgi:hypothetical protein